MKMTSLFLLILFGTFLWSCKHQVEVSILESDYANLHGENTVSDRKAKIDSLNASLDWKETKLGLWKSHSGDLAIKTEEASETGENITLFIQEVGVGEEMKPIKEVIDTLSFRYLGSSFYKDKNHVYTHYVMMDGGNFRVVEKADPQTFRVIGDCYAKDKNYIYGERAMELKNVDYSTFKTEKGLGCHAKDKFGYLFWDERIKLDNPETSELSQIYERLKEL